MVVKYSLVLLCFVAKNHTKINQHHFDYLFSASVSISTLTFLSSTLDNPYANRSWLKKHNNQICHSSNIHIFQHPAMVVHNWIHTIHAHQYTHRHRYLRHNARYHFWFCVACFSYLYIFSSRCVVTYFSSRTPKKERKKEPKKIKNTTNPKRVKARKPEKRGKIMDKLWLWKMRIV